MDVVVHHRQRGGARQRVAFDGNQGVRHDVADRVLHRPSGGDDPIAHIEVRDDAQDAGFVDDQRCRCVTGDHFRRRTLYGRIPGNRQGLAVDESRHFRH